MKKSIYFSTLICFFALNLSVGQTSIIEAIKQNNFLKVEELIKSGKDVNEVNSEYYLTPLLMASLLGKDSMVNLLLKKGANVNLCGGEKFANYSPLSAACIGGNIDVVKSLVSKGADIYKIDGKLFPIDDAGSYGFLDIVEFLKTKGEFQKEVKIVPSAQIKSIQELLYELDLYNNNINGILDASTRLGLKKYKELYSKSFPDKSLDYCRVDNQYIDFMITLTDAFCSAKGCKKFAQGAMSYSEKMGSAGGLIIDCYSGVKGDGRKIYNRDFIRLF